MPEACHRNCLGAAAAEGSVIESGVHFFSLAALCSLLLKAPEKQVFVCQQRVTFGMVVKVIFHMFTDRLPY